MEEKEVICPKCHCRLRVRNSKNEAVKHFECPQCKTRLQVVFRHESAPVAGETVYSPGRQSAGGETVYSSQPSAGGETQLASSTHVVQGMLVYDGEEFDIPVGESIVGRENTTRHTDISIPTDDRFMSRQHIVINAARSVDGGLRVTLRNYHNANPTKVNDMQLHDNDVVSLQNGYRITMGNTTVIYKEK